MKKAMKKNKAAEFSAAIAGKNSILFWLIMAYTVLFLFIAPFYRGLFNGGTYSFEGPIYWAVFSSTFALLVICIYFFKHWQLRDIRDILSLAIWLIPLSFSISLINAASFHAAVNSIYIHCMYSVFFLIGLYFTRSKLGNIIVIYAIVLSGYMLVIYGLLNWFGQADFQDAVLHTRLSNVFQYPNTNSAYMIAILFSAILLIQTAERWYINLFHALFLVPIFVSFLLTFSRGAILELPVILIVLLLFLPMHRQISMLLTMGITAFASLAIMQKLVDIRLDLLGRANAEVSIGWWSIFAASIITAGLVFIINKYIGKQLIKKQVINTAHWKRKNLILPIAIILVGLFSAIAIFTDSEFVEKLPDPLQNRIQSIDLEESSLMVRGTYYKDSFKLLKDYPIIGAGGGAWGTLYESYKSYPYTSRQAHNFFLQYLNETGLLGFVLLLLILGVVCWQFFKWYFRKGQHELEIWKLIYFIVLLTLLIHSMIDFDMTFVYLGTMFFLCLGSMASLGGGVRINNKWVDKLPQKVHFFTTFIVCVILITSVQAAIHANKLFATALSEMNQSGQYQKIIVPLDKAVDLKPYHPEYVLTKVSFLRQAYEQTKDEQYFKQAIENIEKLNPKQANHRKLLDEHLALLIRKGSKKEALQLLSNSVEQYPWDIHLYEKRIALLFEMGNQARVSGQIKIMNDYWGQARQIFDEVVEKRNKLDQLTKAQKIESRKFRVTPVMALSIGQVNYLNGYFENALNVFKLGRVSNEFEDSVHKEIARWYLATLERLNKNHKKIYDLLIKHDPKEKEYIEKIIQMDIFD